MKYRRFGKTELQIPVFSCGGMRYQQSWDDVAPEKVEESVQLNLEATVLRALELGINHIETARGYGSSEMQLGWILPRLPREKMIVQTKIEAFADPQEFRRTFEQSMKNLKLDHVELLSIHGINNAQTLDWSIRKGGCLEVARQLQKEGRCRHVGFSTHATNDIILKAIESDGFDYVNLHWYFVGQLNWSSVLAARARDMGVFIISPSDKGGMLYSPPTKMVELCSPFSPIIFNDLWCLSRPEVHTLSVGAARPSDFDEHVKALEFYEHAAEVVAPVAARLNDELERQLGADWCAHWSEGLPPLVDVPGQVNLQEIFRLWTYAKGLDLVEWGKMRYNLIGNAGHWFPGATGDGADVGAIQKALGDYRFVGRVGEILEEAHALLHAAPKKRLSEGG
ncbi:MAG: aldo/keto reductase [Verrucomicrobiota bacterium]